MINFVFLSSQQLQRPNTQHTLPLKENGGPASEGTGFWEPKALYSTERGGSSKGAMRGAGGLQGCGSWGHSEGFGLDCWLLKE